MSDSDSYDKRASAPQYADAEHVGEHLVIETSEWVPGQNPEPHQGHPEQTEYLEHFYRCIICGVEVLQERDLPESCEGGDIQ